MGFFRSTDFPTFGPCESTDPMIVPIRITTQKSVLIFTKKILPMVENLLKISDALKWFRLNKHRCDNVWTNVDEKKLVLTCVKYDGSVRQNFTALCLFYKILFFRHEMLRL